MPRKLYPNYPLEDILDENDMSPVIDPGPAVDFDAVNKARETGPEKNAGEGEGPNPQEKPNPAGTETCPHCAEADKARLLALAELENARKRLAREKEDFVKFAGESVIADILPAIDNLDLALAYAPEGAECRNFVVGVDMTRKLLLDALSRHGLEQVGNLGESFDPARHEALDMAPHAEYEDGQVCGLMSKGYKLKDRLVRPAKVIVCKK